MVDGEIKALDKRISELKSEIDVLKKDIVNLRSDLDPIQNQDAKIADLNERVRFAMEHIADELEVSLFSLFDPVGKR